MNASETLAAVTEHLYEKGSNFLADIVKIGEPEFTGACRTARVMVVNGKVVFQINPSFLEGKTIGQKAKVFAHEAGHIVLGHLGEMREDYDDMRKFNKACDCVINDYLVANELEVIEGLLYGEEVVGYNCADAFEGDVYDDLPEDDEQESECGMSESNFDWDEIDEETQESFEKVFSDHGIEMPTESDSDESEVDSSEESEESDSEGDSGEHSDDSEEGFQTNTQEMTVESLFKELVKTFEFREEELFRAKSKSSFQRPHNRFVAMPHMRMPIRTPYADGDDIEGMKPPVVVFGDVSGSVGNVWASKVTDMTANFPSDQANLRTCVFANYAKEFTVGERTPKVGSGTDFHKCVRWVEKNVSKGEINEPEVVIVITDGDFGQMITPKNPERWIFVILDGGKAYHPETFRNVKFSEFFKSAAS